MLSFSLFGHPGIELDGDNLSGKLPKKAQALLFYLAMTHKAHDREWLASLFWSEVPTATALKNLRDLLPEVRRLVGAHLIVTRQRLALNTESLPFVDVHAFQERLQTDPPDYAGAFALWQGEFLGDFHLPNALLFEDWVTLQREYLHELAVQNMDAFIEQCLAHRAWETGLTWSARLLTLDPWRESTHRQRMRLLALTGQRGAALAQYATCRKMLADEFGVAPSPQTETLSQQIRANQLETHPAPAPLPQHNLPRSLTPFFGREPELALLAQRLREPATLLVTLMGEGGVGKTRLALTVARRVLTDFPDGVWLIPLAGIPAEVDAALAEERLARALGETLGLSFSAPIPLAQQVIHWLQGRKVLLVLDNLEHLIAGSGFLLALLEHAEGVTLLIASRTRLDAPAEHVFRLDGLPFPAEGTPPQAAMGFPSVKLFAERAARLSPKFVLTEGNVSEIARICRLVEGLPLGIELAAAMTERQTHASIARALETGLHSLGAPRRGVPERHQSLQAVFDYSWHLLSDEEKHTLAQCAVFRGSFSRFAVAEVTGAGVAALVSLTGKSLLRPLLDERFEMHELIRQFAQAKLALSPALQTETEARHCAYFLHVLHENETVLENDPVKLHEIQADLPNFRAAWVWGLQARRVDDLLKGIQPLALVFRLTGLFREARKMFDEALATVRAWKQAGPLSPDESYLFGFILIEQSFFYQNLVGLLQALVLAREALEVGHALGNVHLQAAGYIRLAALETSKGNLTASEDFCQKGLKLAEAGGFSRLQAVGFAGLGIIDHLRGFLERAFNHHSRALEIAREQGLRRFESIITGNLAVWHTRSAKPESARLHAERALALSREIEDADIEGMAHIYLGDIAWMVSQFWEAQTHYENALKIFQQVGDQRYESFSLMGMGLCQVSRGECEAGFANAEKSRDLAQEIEDHPVEARAWMVIGHALREWGRFTEAQAAYEEVRVRVSANEVAIHAMLNTCQADLFLRQNQLENALACVEKVFPHLAGLPVDPPFTDPLWMLTTCALVFHLSQDARGEGVRHMEKEFREQIEH